MKNIDRRKFIKAASACSITAVASCSSTAYGKAGGKAGKLAIKGGDPVRTKSWPSWPIWDRSAEEPIISVLRSGRWYREWGTKVAEFEKKYAEFIGAKRCLATASGTTALLTALNALDIDAGDEVIVSPYTFIATYNVVFFTRALPVFADTDRAVVWSRRKISSPLLM